ncbi:MAG TPA: GNAT family N-acetyltransferase [Hanamia sp.]|nr:GNAT family N-acetyltransferase [Hanamia sp.]
MEIKIIEFSDEYAKFFTSLNIAWLEKYFVVEPMDHEMLSEPKKFIIDKGGYIFFAKVDDEIAGTFALIKVKDGIYELSKMAVEEHFIGKKIGNRMLEFCLDEAKKLKADKIILYSNTKLQPAIHLYKKFGFKEVALDHSEYERANIKMEIDIHS